jgi:hypothetical protein
MNNFCPVESQSIDNPGGHLTYDTGNKYIWPSLPTDANKFIVPPAIYTDYPFTFTFNIKAGHQIFKSYNYRVRCRNIGIKGIIGDVS